MEELKEGDVVVVVGAGHLDGMTAFWERQQDVKTRLSIEQADALHSFLQLSPNSEGSAFTLKQLR